MLKVVTPEGVDRKDFELSLDEIAREGARRLLEAALKLEVEDYVARHRGEVDEHGHRLVVRNGKSKERTVTMGAGSVSVQAPRVNDRRVDEKFVSKILPPYLRKSARVESLLPVLYLKGLSTNNFKDALADILGEGTMGLSPASIVKLKKIWETEFAEWTKRNLTEEYVYIWADGVNVEREPDACPAVALIPAEHPRHPMSHDDVLLRAALRTVERLLDDGDVRIDPRTACRIHRLRRALFARPLHADVSEEAGHGL